ncbi:uncharacterized protein LOC135202731 [Macrobrachium nipponense]|uniref:uncharacterized protein LOC135202731 n=1 Tax=Macrobrachium nipponense TaxID=159736 RepID=UPI0030C86391
MSRFLSAPYKLTILASLLRCISNECLMYDHTNFDEILGTSKFVNMLYKDISADYKVGEPPHGKEIGGAFLLGWPEDTEMKKISVTKPTNINISASFWCHSKETTLYLYSDCNWSYHDFCTKNGKGWHEDFWYEECASSTPDKNYFIIRGNTKQKQQAVGYEYLYICTDGSTVPPKSTTTEITTSTSYTTTTPKSPTTSSTTTLTTVAADSTTTGSTTSSTTFSTTTTDASDSTTTGSTTAFTTSSSESTAVDSDSTSTTATSDESHESTTPTAATTGTTATAESVTTSSVTSTSHNPTTSEGSTTEAPTPDGGCGEPDCILGLTVTQFEIVVVSSVIVFLILVTMILVPLFKRQRTYVTFIKEARPYSVRRGRRRIPGPNVPSRSLSERRRPGNVNRDSGVRIPRVMSYAP